MDIKLEDYKYEESDIISISGKITSSSTGTVRLFVENEKNKLVWAENVNLKNNGEFSTLLIAGGKGWENGGKYFLNIEHDDFMENPPKKFYRLAPGKEVRLRNGYNITCTEIIKNDAGEITELRCSYNPESKGTSGTRKKVKGIIHWVSAKHAINVETRLYDRLFNVPDPAVNN